MINDLNLVELRVLGCLIEKQRTTPDSYPLTLNSLRLACNQATNRDPVVEYDEHTIRQGLERLRTRGWSRTASGPGSRAPKYRHLLDESLELGDDEISVLCVLMLRGPQTPGELKTRCDRMHRFADLAAVHAALDSLFARSLATVCPRRPGQKEQRYGHLLDEHTDEHDQTTTTEAAPVEFEDDPELGAPSQAERIAALEDELGKLREEVAELRKSVELSH